MIYAGWEDDFDRLSPQMQAALDQAGPATHTLADIKRGIEESKYQMWPSHHSVLVTSIQRFPTGVMACNVFLAGGNLEEIRPMVPLLEQWAKEQGCTRMTCTGRHGWARTFITSEDGWIPALTLYSKELA